jgi:hypothetical protein
MDRLVPAGFGLTGVLSIMHILNPRPRLLPLSPRQLQLLFCDSRDMFRSEFEHIHQILQRTAPTDSGC